MCSCNVQGFHEEGNEYIKKLCHFYCHCKEEHSVEETFVLTCRHSLIHRRMEGMQDKCTCKNLCLYEICNFCVQVKYLINFGACKICIRNIPKNIPPKVVPLDYFLKNELLFCEPFFVFSNQKVNIKIDNRFEKYMLDLKKVD